MSKRAELRRKQKEAEKNRTETPQATVASAAKIAAPLNVANYTMEQIAEATGTKIELLTIWKNAREEEFRKAAILEAQQKLWKAEDYTAVANILISVYAIKKTWGFKKAMPRFVENINEAQKTVERLGVDKAYEAAHKEMGIELEFDSMDINKEFGFGELDFRSDGFEDKYPIEIWDEAWESAKDIGNVINTCSIGLALKKFFNFTNEDLKKLIKESNAKADEAKQGAGGVTRMVAEFERETGESIGEKIKKLLKNYAL